MSSKKVGIIGVGAVGATTAYTLSMLGSCHEIILFDITPEIAYGKAIDISQASYYAPQKTTIHSAKTIQDIKDCDIVVITAGVPRKGNITRADLLLINAKIIKNVTINIKKSSPNAIIICVSNPLDVMTYIISKITKWDRSRIIGMAGALDGSRMAYEIEKKTGYSLKQTGNLVIGDHGENMIPLPKNISVGDIPLTQLISQQDMEDIIDKTKNGGAKIVEKLGTSGYYGPGRAVVHMIESILNNNKTIVPSSVVLDGEYGYKNVAIGVPIVLGSKGCESIIELQLDDAIKNKFDISVKSIKDNINILKEKNFFEGF
jgi:malate dehydrogenase